MTLKTTAFAALGCVFFLGACTEPGSLSSLSADPNQQAKQGALMGALVGTGLSVATGGKKGDLLIGAAAGAAAGGLIGSQLDKQAAELRSQLASDGITITNTGTQLVVSLPQDITFATDSFTVRPALQADLRRVAAHLQRYPNSHVQVIGHTDSTGAASYNQDLSERRASAVASVLAQGGVSYNRLVTLGRGESQPIASNLTVEGKARNRRVEIIIIPR
ncbi:OmpA family protein [Pontibaca salina]